MQRGNGHETCGSGRPTAFAKAGSAAASFAQAYDRDGNVLSEGRSLTGVSGDAGANTQSFAYDGANRVTAASGLATSASYAYDRDTNRTSATLGGATTTYLYDRSNALVSRTDAGVTTYLAYDQFGNQTSAAPAVNANTASSYDLADRLVSRTPPGQSATTYTYDALGRTLSRVTPAGTDAYEYVGTSASAWRITSGGVATSSALDPSAARLATARAGTTGYLLADLHGNLAGVVNAAESAILAATRYDAFGQTSAAYDSGGSFPTPWRFQARLDLSPDANPLYEVGARLYDPQTAAFTSLDTYPGSAADPLSLNRYAYALANPWTLVDPDGHMPIPCGGDGCSGTGPPVELPPDSQDLGINLAILGAGLDSISATSGLYSRGFTEAAYDLLGWTWAQANRIRPIPFIGGRVADALLKTGTWGTDALSGAARFAGQTSRAATAASGVLSFAGGALQQVLIDSSRGDLSADRRVVRAVTRGTTSLLVAGGGFAAGLVCGGVGIVVCGPVFALGASWLFSDPLGDLIVPVVDRAWSQVGSGGGAGGSF